MSAQAISGHDALEHIPCSLEAETAVLGALLYDNDVLSSFSHFLKPEHFYSQLHLRIYERMAARIESGQLADAIVLKNILSKDGLLDYVGGVDYLAKLLDNAPPASTAKDYAKLITEMHQRREIIRICQTGEHCAGDLGSDQDSPAQIETLEQDLYSLAENDGQHKGFQSFNHALNQSVDMLSAAYGRDGTLSGIATGLKDLDRQLGGLHKSDLIILAGRPSMGKTALATNIAFHVAKSFKQAVNEHGILKTAQGARIGFFSLEMSAEQLSTRILAEHSGIPSNFMRCGDFSAQDYETIRDSVDAIGQSPLYIDDTGGLSIGVLTARARRLKRTHGLDMVVVDYLQLLVSKGNGRDNRVQEVSRITQGLKALAKELDIPVLALSQLSRQVEQREDKRPQLSDLRESGSIEQDADVVMFVYREEYYVSRQEPNTGTPEHEDWQRDMERLHGKAELIISKQRHGPIGTVRLGFDARLTKFENLSET